MHPWVAGSRDEREHLAFRDAQRLNPETATACGRLERGPAALHEGITLASQEQHSLSKSPFVDSVPAESPRQGLPLPASGDG